MPSPDHGLINANQVMAFEDGSLWCRSSTTAWSCGLPPATYVTAPIATPHRLQ